MECCLFGPVHNIQRFLLLWTLPLTDAIVLRSFAVNCCRMCFVAMFCAHAWNRVLFIFVRKNRIEKLAIPNGWMCIFAIVYFFHESKSRISWCTEWETICTLFSISGSLFGFASVEQSSWSVSWPSSNNLQLVRLKLMVLLQKVNWSIVTRSLSWRRADNEALLHMNSLWSLTGHVFIYWCRLSLSFYRFMKVNVQDNEPDSCSLQCNFAVYMRMCAVIEIIRRTRQKWEGKNSRMSKWVKFIFHFESHNLIEYTTRL